MSRLPSITTLLGSSKSEPSPLPKSLTPLRKHRKLLKDGSGEEVWPESLESIFYQGLQEYWASPLASHARGRSRWRNQFMVDYLQKAGHARTKKQVASHVQVLRNMWKGTSDYHLVAGGEEMSPEGGSPLSLAPVNGVKLEDEHLILFEEESTDSVSSPTSSIVSSFPPSPFKPESFSPSTELAFPSTSLHSSPSSPVVDIGASELPFTPNRTSVITAPTTSVTSSASSDATFASNSWLKHPSLPSPPSPNRVTHVCLLAEGMTPLNIKTDSFLPLTSKASRRNSSAALKIRLTVPFIDDPQSPSTFHGFSANVCFSRVWSSYSKCVTRMYVGGMCVEEEVRPLEVSAIQDGTVIAQLPDSTLSRCRWLDPTVTTSLMQEIIVDDETLAYFIFELHRNSHQGMPSAELLEYKAYPLPAAVPDTTSRVSMPTKAHTWPTPAPQAHRQTGVYPSHYTTVHNSCYPQYTRSTNQQTLSYALAPPAGWC